MKDNLLDFGEVVPIKFKYKVSSLIHRIFDFDKMISKYYVPCSASDYVIDLSENIPRILDKELIEADLYISAGKELYVIFGPWGGKNKLTSGLRDKIVGKGYSCLQLEFPVGFLCSDPEMTSTYFDKISKGVRSKIDRLKEKHGFSEINLLGISLGGSLMAMVANKNKILFNKMIYIGTSASCGDVVFDGVATKKLKKEYQIRGESSKSLNKKYFKMDPINLLDISRDTEIIMHIGRYDTVAPYELGKNLIRKMQDEGFKPTVYIHNQGHYFTILNYLENPIDLFPDN